MSGPRSDAALPRILCVDDEPRIVDGIERLVGDDYDIVPATSGAAGLACLEREGPFAVVVSDMRMPGMDGATFLAKVARTQPLVTRVLLSGQSDMQSAIAAINEGHVFRFLTKPCPEAELRATLAAATRQHVLERAEQVLLTDTVGRIVRLLMEILQLSMPDAFGRSAAHRQLVGHLVGVLRLDNGWIYDAAAALAPLGLISMPPDALTRALSGAVLTPAEQASVRQHPVVGARLIADIPRFEVVAEIVRRQDEPVLELAPDDPVSTGRALLALARAADDLLVRGVSPAQAAAQLAARHGGGLRRMAEGFASYVPAQTAQAVRAIVGSELRVGMVTVEPVRTRTGLVLVAADRDIDRVLLERLRRFSDTVGLHEPITVRMPG